MPLVEAMTAGVPIVARDAGAVGQTVGHAALLLQAGDPSYVAAALHRVCTDDVVRTHARRRRPPPRRRAPGTSSAGSSSTRSPGWWVAREHDGRPRGKTHDEEGRLRLSALRHRDHGRRRDGGAQAGRAPVRADELGGRGALHLRPRRHHVGRRARARHHRAQRGDGAPASDDARAAPWTSTTSTASSAWRRASRRREQGKRWVEYNGPVSPELVDAVCASDADVVAFYAVPLPPDRGHHRPRADARRVPPGGARRAGPLPLGLPRHVRRRRRVLLLHALGALAGRAYLPGGRASPDRARPWRRRLGRARDAGAPTCSAWATARTS